VTAKSFFVTSPGTEIGKTHVAEIFCRQLRARGSTVMALKPVVSGYDQNHPEISDPGRLCLAMGRQPTPSAIDDVCPWRFAAPLSPDMAAQREGRRVALGDIVAFCRQARSADADIFLIEGAGGLMAPLTHDHLNLDLIRELALPALLVSGTYLGTISHTLSALKVLRQERVPVLGVVLSESEEAPVSPDETAAAIGRFAPDIPIRIVPRQPVQTSVAASDLTDLL